MGDGKNKLSFEGSVNETRERLVKITNLLSYSGVGKEKATELLTIKKTLMNYGILMDLIIVLALEYIHFPEAAKRNMLQKFPPESPHLTKRNQLEDHRRYLFAPRKSSAEVGIDKKPNSLLRDRKSWCGSS